uniref:Uncharacterized protein n=1 Tax=Anguilla anguilla TaxID=7936 RepID=A0A0E9QHR6_ANGAN
MSRFVSLVPGQETLRDCSVVTNTLENCSDNEELSLGELSLHGFQ